MILSPELGANLAGQGTGDDDEEGDDDRDDVDDDDDDIDDVSTSGVSTVNSKVKQTKAMDKVYGGAGDELNVLRAENVRLTRELVEAQRQYQLFLKSAIEEQNANVDLMKNFLGQVSSVTRQYDRSISQGYFSDRGPATGNEVQIRVTADQDDAIPSPDCPDAVSNASVMDVSGHGQASGSRRHSPMQNRRMNSGLSMSAQDVPRLDARLNEWLVRHHVDSRSRNLIHLAEFSYEDFLYNLAKDDLLRIGLK